MIRDKNKKRGLCINDA